MKIKGKKIIFFALAFLVGIGLSFRNPKLPKNNNYTVSFGVKIGILPTGGLTQYALIYYQYHKLVSIQPISLHRLIRIGTGKWPIPKTHDFHDFFEENGVYNDTLPNGKVIDFRAAFDSLWKIRFSIHPYDRHLGLGWSQGKIRPSLKQQAYIYNRYGVRGYDQAYFTDSSFFQLIKDVIDPQWIAHYKSLR